MTLGSNGSAADSLHLSRLRGSRRAKLALRSTRSKSAAGGGSLHMMTRGDTPTPTLPASGRGSALPSRLLFHQRAAAVLLRPERILAGNRADDFQQIPFRLRLIRLLDLKQ